MDKGIAKYIFSTLAAVAVSLLSGCVTQSFENNEPIVKTQANRDEMAATRISLGLGYLKMGDMSQAKLNLEKAKQFSPNLVQVHTAFAHYYETVGENNLAIESFEQALSIKADSADTLNNYGVFLCRQDKVEAAEKQFLKAIAVPSYLLVSQSYENLASCYLESDNFEKAEMYLNKAIFHSPNRTATLLQMVRLQYAMGDYKNSKRFLQKFERNTQRFSAESLALAYKLYWKLGQRRTASNYANMLVKMYPQSWESKQYLLNELEFIGADNLARKFQLSENGKNKGLTPSNNKRVVKLSPNKSANSPLSASVATEIASADKKDVVTKTTSDRVPANNIDAPKTAEVAATIKENELVRHAESTALEPTSTQPIPAKRDEPVAEALPAPIEEVETEMVKQAPVEKAVETTLENEPLAKVVATAVIAEDSITNEERVSPQVALHTVSAGENLYNISVKYNVKLKALRKWNNISEKNTIRIGDKLYVVDPQTVKKD